MSDFFELAAKRQSCRGYTDVPVEHDKLVKIVDAARLAPSGCNAQPWKVVVVETPNLVKEVASSVALLGINNYLSSATAFFVILEERAKLMPKVAQFLDSQVFAKGDLGGFALSICFAAESLGVGTCMVGMYDRPRLRELLSIPEHYPIFLVIAAGYPSSDHLRKKDRRPLEEIARFV
jgi:nitroreductase